MGTEGGGSREGGKVGRRGVPCSPRPPQRSPPTGRSLRSCLISSRIFSCRVLCFWGKGRSLLSETWRKYGSSRKEGQWAVTRTRKWGGTLGTQPGPSGADTAGGRRKVPRVLLGQVLLRINLPAPPSVETPFCPWGGEAETPPSPPCTAGTCFSGGRERIKSRMSSWASFFTLGGMSPSTCEGGSRG